MDACRIAGRVFPPAEGAPQRRRRYARTLADEPDTVRAHHNLAIREWRKHYKG